MLFEKICDRGHCFQFQNDLTFNNQIEPIITNWLTFINHQDWHLLFTRDALSSQFQDKRSLVNIFCEARTKLVVDLISNLHQLVRQLRIKDILSNRLLIIPYLQFSIPLIRAIRLIVSFVIKHDFILKIAIYNSEIAPRTLIRVG